MSEYWDSGTEASGAFFEALLCLMAWRRSQKAAIKTNGMPIPRPTPKPTLIATELELSPDDDAAGVPVAVGVVSMEVEFVAMELVDVTDDVVEVVVVELEVDEVWVADEMLK